jgi:hypothetical protein
MLATIKAEWIRGSGHFPSRPHPWVAKVTGLCDTYGLARDFQSPVYDYTYARGKRAGRGIYLYWFIGSGLYEIYRPVSWKHHERFYFWVANDGSWHELKKEAAQCLASAILE